MLYATNFASILALFGWRPVAILLTIVVLGFGLLRLLKRPDQRVYGYSFATISVVMMAWRNGDILTTYFVVALCTIAHVTLMVKYYPMRAMVFRIRG